MKDLTFAERATLIKIFNKLCECDLFVGKYDAKNGKEAYMHGISAVMESIAYMISEEVGDSFNDTFIKNMIESEERR